MWTAFGDPSLTVRSRRAGLGYLEKTVDFANPDDESITAIREEIVRALARRAGMEQTKLAVARWLTERCRLSPAEAGVLELIAVGATAPEIARETGKSKRTINNQLASIFAKLRGVVRENSVQGIAYWIMDRVVWELYGANRIRRE